MKNTYRFFVPAATVHGESVAIADEQLAHQLGRVLRLRPGDHIELLPGDGSVCQVTLESIDKQTVRGAITGRYHEARELPFALTLYLAVIKPERFEWALQKAVELGYTRIVPVNFARSQHEGRIDGKRLERWRRIIREASEQSGRAVLTTLDDMHTYVEACQSAQQQQIGLLLFEGKAPPLRQLWPVETPQSVAILSGPEGGISAEELTIAANHGIMAVSLGPRILRAETAPLAVAAALSFALGEAPSSR